MESRFFSSPIITIIFVFFILKLNPWLVLAKTHHHHHHHDDRPCHFPAIFNFGDSNSDTGGLSALFSQAPPPNGISFFGHPAGRFCDGRLIIDFIAENFGLPYLSAYLDSVGSNFSHGANFATAGSTIRPQNTTIRQSGLSPIALDVQWVEFYDFQRRSSFIRNNKGGVYKKLLPEPEEFSRALYTFDIGENDLIAGYLLNMTLDEVKSYVPDVITQFQNVIRYIYGQGGRYFWIHNTGPTGCLAFILERFSVSPSEIDEAGCAIPYNEVAQYFNSKLKEVVVQLRKDLALAVITYVDVYSPKYSLFSEGPKHGFRQPLRTCCGHGGKYNYNIHVGCGGKKKINGTQVLIGKACKDPSTSVVWDGVHFTQAANKYIFDRILDGSFSDPPTPLNMACRYTHQIYSLLSSTRRLLAHS